MSDWLPPLLSVLLSGGLVVGLLKVRPEASVAATAASEAAVRVMQQSMVELDHKVNQLEERERVLLETVARCEKKIDRLTMAVMRHEAENGRLESERNLWRSRAIALGFEER